MVRDEAKNLYCVKQIETVDSDQMEVIFGRDFKLEAADPYLFYAYQFRRFSLRAKLIVVIGYGFADMHINKMLTQALRGDESLRLLLVTTSRVYYDLARHNLSGHRPCGAKRHV